MITAKKSLGQNFFINKNLAEKIVKITLEDNPKYLIEIGPGTGSFTQIFSKKLDPQNIIVIEKDDSIAEKWKKYYSDIELIHDDVLNIDLSNFQVGIDQKRSMNDETVLFGSLPYYIAKKIIRKTLKTTKIKQQYFIIQKEVAEKYLRFERNEKHETNPLGIGTRIFAKPDLLLDISPGSFRPQPKVTSSFIKFNKEEALLPKIKREMPNFKFNEFNNFLYKCFNHPRKTLQNNLKKSKYKYLTETLSEDILKRRPGNLGINEYLSIYLET
jgi:16S rRNA (adenine1518-N6/adenine1519-N6)-dimethyltransferase